MTSHRVAVLVGVSALSCVGPYPIPAVQMHPPETRHWVHDARLRDIMATLGRNGVAFWPQEIEDEKRGIDHADLDEAATLAADLAAAAEMIPSIVADIKMIEADRRAFRAQAQTLRDQAQTFRQAILDQDLRRMRQSSAAVETTCNACHVRFRDFCDQSQDRRIPDGPGSSA